MKTGIADHSRGCFAFSIISNINHKYSLNQLAYTARDGIPSDAEPTCGHETGQAGFIDTLYCAQGELYQAIKVQLKSLRKRKALNFKSRTTY